MKLLQRGFTIVELLIIVIVIGLLLAIAVPIFSGAAPQARDRARETDARAWAAIFDSYKARYGVWPLLPTNDLTPASACLGGFSSTSSKCVQYTDPSALRYINAATTPTTTLLTSIAKVSTVPASLSSAVKSVAIGPFVYVWQSTSVGTVTVTGVFMSFFESSTCPTGFTASSALTGTNYANLAVLLLGLPAGVYACGLVTTFTYNPNSN